MEHQGDPGLAFQLQRQKEREPHEWIYQWGRRDGRKEVLSELRFYGLLALFLAIVFYFD